MLYSTSRYRSFKKIILLSLLFFLPLVVSINVFELETTYINVLLCFALLASFFVLFKVFIKPLDKVTKEIAALVASKPYSRLNIFSKDEFGLIAFFFNDITKNIEKISYMLKEGSRMSEELSIASSIQQSVLPKSIPKIPFLDTVAKTRSAEEIGGDSFAISPHNDNYFIYIGDVTGHGAPAGLVMMITNTLFEVLLPKAKKTKDLASSINKLLKPRVNSTMFMTTVFFRFDPKQKRMFYTGCGHEHILVYRADEGVTEVITTGGIALAMADDIEKIVEEKEIKLKANDVVVLYSDGITEAINDKQELFGLERLTACVSKYGHLGDSLKIFEAISKDVTTFVAETIQNDDMTLICMRLTELDFKSDREQTMLVTNW
jgi:serine phosphatase RsbU (regulator of sigma subunit)